MGAGAPWRLAPEEHRPVSRAGLLSGYSSCHPSQRLQTRLTVRIVLGERQPDVLHSHNTHTGYEQNRRASGTSRQVR
jgi:hypothetical protein